MGVHIQPSPMPYQASKEGGRSHPRPRSADRHPRFAGRGATESVPATCGIGGVPIAGAISCPATPKVPWALVDRHRAHRFGSGPTPSARAEQGAGPAEPRLAEMPRRRDVSNAQIVQSIIEKRNRMMARTKRVRRSYGAGEWGRNRVRVFPDPKTGLYQIE